MCVHGLVVLRSLSRAGYVVCAVTRRYLPYRHARQELAVFVDEGNGDYWG